MEKHAFTFHTRAEICIASHRIARRAAAMGYSYSEAQSMAMRDAWAASTAYKISGGRVYSSLRARLAFGDDIAS